MAEYSNEARAVKKIRAHLGLSQLELAKVLGYTSPQFVSNAERGLCGLPGAAMLILDKEYGRCVGDILADAKLKDFKLEMGIARKEVEP